MQNPDLTWFQNPGAVTELLSGEFFAPLGRSTSHQLWSSAMVLTPAIRGLFGLEADALHHILRVRPQLPARWEYANLNNVTVGAASFDIQFRKEGGKLLINARSADPQPLCLTAGENCTATTASTHRLELNLPAFEVDPPQNLPPAGSTTALPKILSKSDDGFEIEGLAGSSVALFVRFVRPPILVSGASFDHGSLLVRFPAGEGYQRTTVRFIYK
jgi:hypothetical protein